MKPLRRFLVAMSVLSLSATTLVGCGDKTIALGYRAPASAPQLSPSLSILPANDRRGNEGDRGDAFRVGGVYGGYGNRLVKVMVREPWPPKLTAALVAEFRAVGVDAVAADRPTAGRAAWLDFDVTNFSTEARWGREAHIAAVVRLHAPDGRRVVDKRIEARESGYGLNNFDESLLEELLNRAFATFVRRVATDPEILAALKR